MSHLRAEFTRDHDLINRAKDLISKGNGILTRGNDIFHGTVNLPYMSDIIKYEGIILWIFVQSDTINDLILFVPYIL